MGLTPVWNEDGWFNAPAASAAYELVMKMDDDEARAFATQVVAETLWETMGANQRTLQTHLDRVIAKRASAALSALPEDHELREELSKAAGRNPYYYGYTFDENDVNRDRRTGQFRAKVKYQNHSSIPDRQAKKLRLPERKDAEKLASGRVGDKKLAQYQQGYAQIANFLENFQDNGLAGDTDFIVTLRDHHTGRTYSRKFTGTEVPKIDPATQSYDSIVARPSGLTGAGASFGLVSALGGERSAYTTAATVDRVDRNFNRFSDDWSSAGADPRSSNDRLYGRVKAGSEFLGQVAPAGSKLQIAAGFGSFVGSHGPQAEKVIGPKARATMYRYRGTEKTPDSELTREYDKAMRSPTNVDGSESGTLSRRVATAFMQSKVPNQRLYDLNLKSGHTPPSEGLIIDRNGKIVTQAIGYGDDHYLPFNLRNLKGLKGGEYIRTRSVGGPTTEDIYTGLVTGAKRVTVTSRSGTFVVEFDDTFRGTRRYNDKAARMVERYGKLVDAVKSEQVVRQPLEPSVRQAIRDDVERSMSWASASDRKKEIVRRETEYKTSPSITAEDERMIEVQVRQAAGRDGRDADAVRAQLRNQVLESKAYNFRLNGDGYAAAITALQEQFPYYVSNVFYAPKRDVGRFESETDRGYVKPRHNRPEGAWEGYFDETIAGSVAGAVAGAKFTADQADFQNARRRPAPPSEGEGGVPTANGTLKPAGPGTPNAATRIADEMARKEKAQPLADKAVELRELLRTTVPVEVEKANPIFAQSEEAFRADVLAGKTKDLEAAWLGVKSFVATNLQYKGVRDAGEAFEMARDRSVGTSWSPAALGAPPKAPLEFSGQEYMMGGDPGAKMAALEKISTETWLPGGRKVSALRDDADFIKEIKGLQTLRDASATIAQYGGDAAAVAAVRGRPGLGELSDADFNVVVKQPQTLDHAIENTHRAWTLRDRWREAQGASLDQLFNTPSAQRGELPKASPGVVTITPPLRTTGEKKVERQKFERAIDTLSRHSEAAEAQGDYAKARDYELLIMDLQASLDEPHSVNARETWQRYEDYIHGRN